MATNETVVFAECDACKRTIRWTVTAKKRRMPVDAVPVIGGTFRLVRSHTDPTPTAEWVARAIRGQEPLYVSHFATCPKADSFRKPTPAPADIAAAASVRIADEAEAGALADELIRITRIRLGGRQPLYLDCREDWPAFRASRQSVRRQVLELVGAQALRKLHPAEAAKGDRHTEARA